MTEINFKTLDELLEYREKHGLEHINYWVHPDYITAIIGIADSGQIIYDFDKMVEFLSEQYRKEGNLNDGDDPEEMAVEWIKFNCPQAFNSTMPIIVYRDCAYLAEMGFNDKPFRDFIDRMTQNALIGMDTSSNICFNSEKMSSDDYQKLEKYKNEIDDFDYIVL